MLGFSRWQIFKTSAAAVLTVGTISLLLIYFIPAPPSTVTMATGFKGSSFEYFGQRYRDIFARSHVELKLRETDGAVTNVELLKDPNSGVQIALAFGGISDGERAPDAAEFDKESRLFGRTDRSGTGVYHFRPFGRPQIEAYFGAPLPAELAVA